MRIKQLMIRTAKPDQTKENNTLENMMERAGLIKKHENLFFYTPLGILLRNRVEKNVIDYLVENGFIEGHLPKSQTVSTMMSNISKVNKTLISSYKDLPVKLFYKGEIHGSRESQTSLWLTESQTVLVFSMAGLYEEKIEVYVARMFALILKDIQEYEGAYFYPLLSGKESFKTIFERGNKDSEPVLYPRVERVLVETPAKRTVKEVCEYLSISEDDLLKTMLYTDGERDYGVLIPGSKEVDLRKLARVLGVDVGGITQKEESKVSQNLAIVPGYLGPVGLRVSRILIDYHVLREKPYVTGGNKEDYHLKGVMYGRDYKGDFYDLAVDPEEEKGWVLGEIRTDLPMIRVQNAESGLDYIPLQAAYLNLDRWMLSVCHQAMEKNGFHFPKNMGWFDAVVTVADRRDLEALEGIEKVYQLLINAGVNVILDDRKDRLGSKFRDYDLVSIPQRIILGKNFEEKFDLKNFEGELVSVNFQNVVAMVEKGMLKSKNKA